MCHSDVTDPNFFAMLLLIDQQIALRVKDRGCEHCQSPLHCAHYLRKPRGIPESLKHNEAYLIRYSFCCSNPDCRKRHTPGSVRFLGRRVYLGVMVVLTSVLADCDFANVTKFSISRQTRHRWTVWWNHSFLKRPLCQTLKGQQVNVTQLPKSWFDRLGGKNIADKLIVMLKWLVPLTTNSSHYFTEGIFPQNL